MARRCASIGRLTASHFARANHHHLLHRVQAMADSDQAERSLFFAGSDDERDDGLEYITPPHPVQRPESAQPQPEPGPSKVSSLFFADSEDEDEPPRTGDASPIESTRESSLDAVVGVDAMELDAEVLDSKPGRASSVSSISSAPPPGPSSPASSVEPMTIDEPLRKKRKLSPDASESTAFTSAYLGSFLVGNAWSTVRGKGYINVSAIYEGRYLRPIYG